MQFKYLASAIILASLTACGGGGGSGSNNQTSSNLDDLRQGLTDFYFNNSPSSGDFTFSKDEIKLSDNILTTTDQYFFNGSAWAVSDDTSAHTSYTITTEGELISRTSADVILAEQNPNDSNNLTITIKDKPKLGKGSISIINAQSLSGQTISEYLLSNNKIVLNFISTDKEKAWIRGFGDKTFSSGAKSYSRQYTTIEKSYYIDNYDNRLKGKNFASLQDDEKFIVEQNTYSINKTKKQVSKYTVNASNQTVESTYSYEQVKAGDLTVYEFGDDTNKNALIEYAGDILLASFDTIGSKNEFHLFNTQAFTDINDWIKSADADHQVPKDLSSL